MSNVPVAAHVEFEAVFRLDGNHPISHARAVVVSAQRDATKIFIAEINEHVAGILTLHHRRFFQRDFVA